MFLLVLEPGGPGSEGQHSPGEGFSWLIESLAISSDDGEKKPETSLGSLL